MTDTARSLRAGALVLFLAAGILSGCSGPQGGAATAAAASIPEGQAEEADNRAITVGVAPLTREALSSLYSTSGTLRADRWATITARTRGIVHRLLVEEGDRVEAGQPLANLEDAEQRIAVERARATRLTTSQDFERTGRLYEQGLVSDEVFEASRREAVDADQAASLAELELSRTVIRAPFAGVVLHRHLDVGATVSDGTAVYDLADLDPLYADVNVPERHVLRLAPDQEVRLTADASGKEVLAAIERIAPAVDAATGTVKVTLAVSADAQLRPGAFVRVDIVTDTHADALVVPRPALVAEGRRWHLFRVLDDSQVEQVEVRIGFEEGQRVEIVQVVGGGDLDAGMNVVVAGASALSHGSRIRVAESTADGVAGVTP